jgi:hypothetical protein
MTGALILYDDQVHKAAIHSFTTEQTGFEVANVQDQDLSTLWKPTATGTDAQVVFDLGSATVLTSWAILAHTICASGPNRNIRLAVGSTDNGTTFDTVVAYFINWSTAMTNPWPHICGTFSAVTKRYWRIKIYGTTAPDYEIGGFFLGQHHHFDDEPAQPLRDNWGDSFTASKKMSGRTEIGVEGGQSRKGLVVWPYASEDTADAVLAIYAAQKGGYAPVVFADHHATYQPGEGPDPYGPYPHAGEIQYCTLERPSVKRLKVGDLYRVRMPIQGVF